MFGPRSRGVDRLEISPVAPKVVYLHYLEASSLCERFEDYVAENWSAHLRSLKMKDPDADEKSVEFKSRALFILMVAFVKDTDRAKEGAFDNHSFGNRTDLSGRRRRRRELVGLSPVDTVAHEAGDLRRRRVRVEKAPFERREDVRG